MNGPENHQKPHFVLIPLMAQGHTIPTIDMARLLAEHGAFITFVTTPLNATRIQSAIDSITASNLSIQFLKLCFPCSEVGLPSGCESIDLLSGRDQVKPFLEACEMLEEPLVSYLREQNPKPSCIISDLSHPWTGDVARQFGIPRFMFNGSCGFSNFCRYVIHQNKVFEHVSDENELVVLPEIPGQIEISKAKSPGNFCWPEMERFRESVLLEENGADGVVLNSFHELEGLYIDSYSKTIEQKIWPIGPMLLCNKEINTLAARGNKLAIDEQQCRSWLDSMKPGSVAYVGFGSLDNTMPPQLMELGLGLENSNQPFIWVIKSDSKEIEEWLASGFEERVKDRGLVIRGWAPQMMILSHPAIGGFMTHCGWNSVLESVTMGVPMITWPHFAEQFLNEKLIVEILRVGVKIGVNDYVHWTARERKVSVKRDDVERAIFKLMGEGGEAEEIRLKAIELGEKAKLAMKKGGSSHTNIGLLIKQVQDICFSC